MCSPEERLSRILLICVVVWYGFIRPMLFPLCGFFCPVLGATQWIFRVVLRSRILFFVIGSSHIRASGFLGFRVRWNQLVGSQVGLCVRAPFPYRSARHDFSLLPPLL